MALTCPECGATPTVPTYRTSAIPPTDAKVFVSLVLVTMLLVAVGATHLVLATFNDPDFQRLWTEQPESELPEHQDRPVLFRNALTLFIWVPAATCLILAGLLGVALVRARSGGPTVWRMFRNVSIAAAIVAVLSHLVLVSLFEGATTFHPEPILGYSIVTVPALVWFLRRRTVKQYFGVYDLVQAPKEAVPEVWPAAR